MKNLLLLRKLSEWTPGKLARNTYLASGWQVVRIGLQIVYLILAARLLGAKGYGWFAGTLALASSFSPFVGVGFGLILVKHVARYPALFPVYWGQTITAILFSAPILMASISVLAYLLLPDPKRWDVIGLLLFSELLLAPLMVAAANAWQAHEKLGRSTFIHVMLNLLRLIATILLIVIFGHVDIELFGWGYFIATFISSLIALAAVTKKYGWPDWKLKSMLKELKEGMWFSASLGVASAQAEFDKTLMFKLSSAESAGVYSVASRVVSAVSIPLLTFVLAASPRLFREGENGMAAVKKASNRLLLPIFVYGIVAGAGIFVMAPVLPFLLGEDFARSVPIIIALCVMPLLVGISGLLLAMLSCSGAQKARVMVELVSLSMSVVLNVILIPSIGAWGAVISVLMAQLFLMCMTLIVIKQTSCTNI